MPQAESRLSIPIRGARMRCGSRSTACGSARSLVEVVAAESLSVGRELDDELQERLSAAADVEAAFAPRFARWSADPSPGAISVAGCCGRGIRGPRVEAALERVAQLGLLDDAAFAQSYVETRAARGRGPARLVRDLMAMGVERARNRSRSRRPLARGQRPR